MLRKLDSSHRANQADTPADFQLNLSQPISGKWTLKSCFICADFPNVSSSNNRIPFTENATQKLATVTPGYYANNTIAAAVKTALDTASGGFNTYTVSLDSVTQKLTITASSGAFTLDWASSPTYSMASALGFEATDTASGLTTTGTKIVVLNSVLGFNIAIDGLTNIVNAKGSGSTFYLPMDSNIGSRSFSTFEPNGFQQTIDIKEPIGTLRIRILNDDGQVLDLQQNWQMILSQELCPW